MTASASDQFFVLRNEFLSKATKSPDRTQVFVAGMTANRSADGRVWIYKDDRGLQVNFCVDASRAGDDCVDKVIIELATEMAGNAAGNRIFAAGPR